MGEKDRQLKKYLEAPDRLADLANGILFQGRQLIRPECLEYVRMRKSIRLGRRCPETASMEKAAAEGHSAAGAEAGEGRFPVSKPGAVTEEEGVSLSAAKGIPEEDRKTEPPIYLERERDDIRRHRSPDMDCYIACEGQSGMDASMPLREWTYDAVEYTNQLEAKENSGKGEDGLTHPLIPVLNIVLYFGESRWKSKHSLREMMRITGNLKEYAHLLPDYQLHLADVREQDPALFKTEWKDVFAIMGKSRKKEDLRAYIRTHTEALEKLTPPTQQFILALLDCHNYTPEQIEKEGITVCKAWDEAMQDYKEEGRQEGRQEGREEGRQEGREEGIAGVIEILQGYGVSRERIIQEIQERFCLSHQTAEDKYSRYTLTV